MWLIDYHISMSKAHIQLKVFCSQLSGRNMSTLVIPSAPFFLWARSPKCKVLALGHIYITSEPALCFKIKGTILSLGDVCCSSKLVQFSLTLFYTSR